MQNEMKMWGGGDITAEMKIRDARMRRKDEDTRLWMGDEISKRTTF